MDTHLAVRTRLAPFATAALLALVAACSDAGNATASTSADNEPEEVSPVHGRPTPPVQPGVIRGVVVLGDEIADDLPAPPRAYDSLFIIGRRHPDDRMPGLITKVPVSEFPIPFQLDARDMMGVGTLSGDWYISVRLDSDGDASALTGDVEGGADGPASVGDHDVQLVLRTVRSEAGRPVVIDGQSGHGAPDQRMLGSPSPRSSMPAGHPPVSPGHPPVGNVRPGTTLDAETAHSAGGPSGQPPKIPGPRIQGTVDLDGEFAGATGTLYLMVNAQVGPRMPRVVMKIDAPTFPLEFDMGPEHVPLQVENKADMLTGDLVIYARLDYDGNAMTKGQQDVVCEAVPVVPDGEDVALVLDRRPQ